MWCECDVMIVKRELSVTDEIKETLRNIVDVRKINRQN